MNIIGISGSLRKDSFNTQILSNVKDLLGPDHTFKMVNIADLPYFNEDLENNLPTSVSNFLETIKTADVVVISTPEYNRSVSGVLKNAIDWASRGDAVLRNKKVATISSSLGVFGGTRAYDHLNKILQFVGANLINTTEVNIGKTYEKFENGKLTDEITLGFVNELIKNILN